MQGSGSLIVKDRKEVEMYFANIRDFTGEEDTWISAEDFRTVYSKVMSLARKASSESVTGLRHVNIKKDCEGYWELICIIWVWPSGSIHVTTRNPDNWTRVHRIRERSDS